MTRDPEPVVDVAVVGCGPTGAVLANLLAQSGVSVLTIEREATVYPLPRAVHFDDECMRVFQTIGIADTLSALVRRNPGMRFVDPQGKTLLDWPRPPGESMQAWHASYRLHQPDLERLLRDRLGSSEHAASLTDCTVTHLEQHPNSVTLHTVDNRSRQTNALRARYVVGCDGANSLVRSCIKSRYEDLGFEERWLVADLQLSCARPDLGDYTLQYCNPERPATYCRNPGTRRRWEFRLRPDENDQLATSPDFIWSMLAPWVDASEARLERSAVYTFRSAIADRWQASRIMLAGDAAHLTPPFMGQGMCAGIRDAANLAWKLARCVQRKHSVALLERYESERKPHVSAYIETAMRLGGLINTVDQDNALSLAERGSNTMASLSKQLGAVESGAHSLVGTLFPQPRLADNSRLDDCVGYAPVLLTLVPCTAPKATDISCFNGEAHPEIARCLASHGVTAVLLRADRYVAAVAESEQGVDALLLHLDHPGVSWHA